MPSLKPNRLRAVAWDADVDDVQAVRRAFANQFIQLFAGVRRTVAAGEAKIFLEAQPLHAL